MTGYSAGFQEVMSKRMQRIHHKTDVFRAIASFEERSNLVKGDTVHRLKKTLPRVQTYVRGTAMSIGAHAEADESLTVNVSKVAPFYVDDLDQLQFNFKYQMEFGQDMAVRLGNFIDGDVLGEVTTAITANVIDDLVINPSTGTSGNGVTVSVGNIQRVFSTAQRKLTKAKIPMSNRFVVLSPELYQSLIDYLAGKNTPLADKIGPNGDVGASYYSFQLYMSNAALWTGTLSLVTQPTDGDTVVINGVTFTFKTTLGSTAGNVLIGGSADVARANLAGLINTPGTTDSNGVAIDSTTDTGDGFTAIDKLTGITATNSNSLDTLVIRSEGNGAITVSETLTAAADVWTAALQIEHIMFGRKGATDVVIQAEPKIEVKDVPDKLGKNVIPWTLYGLKTFREGTAMLVDFKRRTDTD